jgi:hypothetical protein
MDEKTHNEIKVHERKKGDGDQCDNQREISLTKNPTQHARTKHIDVQHHFVQKQVENGKIMFEYCSKKDMVVNVLTKALSKEQHNKLISMFRLETS